MIKILNDYVYNTNLSIETVYEIYINHLITLRDKKIDKILEN